MLDEATYQAWLPTWTAAELSLTQRKEKLEAAAAEMEHGFDFLGFTGVEDMLQEGVPHVPRRPFEREKMRGPAAGPAGPIEGRGAV